MTTTFSCDPGWTLNGENCFWAGITSDRTANFEETMKRNCGANMDFADPARCKPRIRRATAVQNFNPPPAGPPTGCGNSYVHIVPELLRMAVGQDNRLTIDFHPDPNVAVQPGQPRDGKMAKWYVNGQLATDQPFFNIGLHDAAKNPGMIQVILELDTFLEGCNVKIKDMIVIIVFDPAAPPEPTPPPPTPQNNGCPQGQELRDFGGLGKMCGPCTNKLDQNGSCFPAPPEPTPPPNPEPKTCTLGYHLDNSNNCIKDSCMEGFHMGADGQTCEKTDINNNCPTGTYNSGGTCIPIPGSGTTFDNSYGGYNRLSSNYQTASSFNDVFSTPENNTKPAAASGLPTNTILIALAAVAGIGGIYYLSNTNVRRRYF